MTSIPRLHAAADVFNAVFASELVREIPYSQKWENGTGYLDGAVHDNLGLNPGEVVKTTTPMPNNRKVLIVGSPVGNLVIFERYTAGQGEIYVANALTSVEQMFGLGSSISDASMAKLFGQEGNGAMFSEYNLRNGNAGAALAALVSDYDHLRKLRARIAEKA